MLCTSRRLPCPHMVVLVQDTQKTQFTQKVLTLLPCLLLCLAITTNMLVGPSSDDTTVQSILFDLRLQRTLAAALAGAALASAGVLIQGLFRNVLASPSVIGVTAGAMLGGQTILLAGLFCAGGWLGGPQLGLSTELLVPLGCVGGGLLTLFALLSIAGRVGTITILLVGVMLTALLGALGALATSLALSGWELARTMLAFTLGGVDATGSKEVQMAAPLIVCALVAGWVWSRNLDIMVVGEEEAAALGCDIKRTRFWCVVYAALLCAGAVSLAGGLSFVGLVIPHILRLVVGSKHRPLFFQSALGGAAFVVACDVACRSIPTDTTLPLGVLTALFGAPFLIVLLVRQHREMTL